MIGLLWASTGSIIGSGWLFGAQEGLQTAGPAAVISWVIGGFAILLLALVHAELGAMWPVAGGTARFPHYAFGGAAGASFGWFSWLQAATVAPIEVLAMITYAQHYSFAHSWVKPTTGVLTTTGIIVACVLMLILSSINFLGVRKLAHTNSAATWWKVAVPLATILVVSITSFHASNFTTADGFSPDGAHGVLTAVAVSGIIFAYLGFEQPTSSPVRAAVRNATFRSPSSGRSRSAWCSTSPCRSSSSVPFRPARSARPGRRSTTVSTPPSPVRGHSSPRW